MVRSIPLALWGIGLAFNFMFLYASDKAFRATVSKLLILVANIGFGGIHGHGAAHPFGFLKGWDETIKKYIRNGMIASERGMVAAFTKAAEPFLLIVGVTLALGLTLYELAKYVKHQASQALTRADLPRIAKPITNTIRATGAITKAQFNHLTAEVHSLEHRVARFAHAAAGTIAQPFPRIGRLERDLVKQGKRVKKLEKLLAAGVGVAVLIRALSKLGLGWLRCSNVKKTGKAVCGMNPALLEALLLDAALLTVTFNLEAFAKEMQTVTEEAASLIHKFAD